MTEKLIVFGAVVQLVIVSGWYCYEDGRAEPDSPVLEPRPRWSRSISVGASRKLKQEVYARSRR